MAIQAKRLESQTYQIGNYVAFQTESHEWKTGKPLDWNEPVGGGLEAGTVVYRRTLRECVSHVGLQVRAAQRV